MTSPRRLTSLLIALILALGSAGPAFAQSAGDEQYSDPLAPQTDQGSGAQAPTDDGGAALSGAPQGDPAAEEDLSDPPPLSEDAGTGGDSTSGPSDPAPTRLPDTGLDALGFGLLGLALLLAGIGLRLRTADARF